METAGLQTHPAVFDSVVVFASLDGYVRGHQRSDGSLRWDRQIGARIQASHIAAAGGLAIVPQWDLVAMHPDDGRIVWRFAGPDRAAGTHSPAVAGDTVFAVSAFGWVSAVDARSGVAFWSVDVGEAPFEPAVGDDLVIVGTRGFLGPDRQGPLGAGHVIALRRSDGAEIWRFPLPDSLQFLGGAVAGGVVWNDLVVVGGVVGHAFGLRLVDGSVAWAVSNGLNPVENGYRVAPAVLDGVALFPRDNGGVEGRDAATGQLRWERAVWAASQPEVREAGAFLVGAGSVKVLDAAGEVAWQFGGLTVDGGTSFRRPAVSLDQTVFVQGTSPFHAGTRVYAIKPSL